MRLFFHLSRDTGLSWVSAGDDGARRLDHRDTYRTLDYVALTAFCRDASAASVIVAWDVAPKLKALAAAAERAGIAPMRAGIRLELAEILGAPATDVTSAEDVAAHYFGERAPLFRGILPDGATPSAEQWAIMLAFERGDNIVCRAVAGAGKTTTLLLCARRRPAVSCLIVTYNKRLQLDVAGRAKAAGSRVSVLTYHSAAGRAYGCTVQNDEIFRRVVVAAPEAPLRFDVLMVDEAQDMALEYFVFVRYLLQANPAAQLVVVGDELQAINEYRGARPEFLSEAPRLYNMAPTTTSTVVPTTIAVPPAAPSAATTAAPSVSASVSVNATVAPRQWTHCRLSVSHRLTPATAAFVNRHLYRADTITGGNRRDPSRPPVYRAAQKKSDVAIALAEEVRAAVTEFGAAGVFVLAPSVRNLTRSESPLADLVRRHLSGVPTFIGGDDDARIDADLIAGKLAVLSFNAAKGCERPCVVIVGLDETYFDYFDRTWDEPDAVPNVLTVAATRASARLVVVAAARRTLRTVSFPELARLTELRGVKPSAPRVRARPPQRNRAVSVTDLVRHQHPETVRCALDLVVIGPAAAVAARLAGRPPAPGVSTKVRFGVQYEDLSFVYGIVGPVLAELARSGETAFGEGLEAPAIVPDNVTPKPFSTEITQREYDAYPDDFWINVAAAAITDAPFRSTEEWARLAVARNAIECGHHHVARQVLDYHWVDPVAVADTRDTILHVLGDTPGEFEVRLPPTPAGGVTIVGRADFIAEGRVVWEFKCGSEYREEHALQLACYLALRGGGEGVLLSISAREARTVTLEPENAAPLLAILAAKARAPATSIFDLIAAFDRDRTIPGATEAENSPASVAWDLSDVY